MQINWRTALKNSWRDIQEKRCPKKTYNIRTSKAKSIAQLADCLEHKKYRFGKWTARFQKKADNKSKRPILIPPLKDRIVLKAIANYVSRSFKAEFKEVSDSSFAYQKGRSVRDALIQLKRRYSKGKIILELDIQKFFNNIDRDLVCSLLEKKIEKSDYILTLIRESLSPMIDFTKIGDASIADFDRSGIPQGNPVSPILSNLYLYDFDVKMKTENHIMIRYVDDMVFVLDSDEEAQKLASDILKYLEESRRLTLHPIESTPDAKSCILNNLKKNRLTFLGVEFDGEKLLLPRSCMDKLTKQRLTSILNARLSDREKIQRIKEAISQWCGYYAFTDVSNCKLKKLSSIIIQKAKYSGIDIEGIVDLVKTMHSARKRQRRKIFPRTKIKGDISWLLSY